MRKHNFYRVGQAAKELGVSSYKIRKLAESGLIGDAEFSGAQWHIPVDAVERMKRDGVPPLPKVVDIDKEEGPAANQKERPPSTLLADPSPEMVGAAEEAEISSRRVTVAKNRLEQKRVLREETEIDDYYADREKRLKNEEAEQLRRDEEQWESDQRQQDKETAIAWRRAFTSNWLEYALKQIPYGAPHEVQLDVHEATLETLGKLDPAERNSVVQRLVDGAVERGLKRWNTEKAKRAATEKALSRLPYAMQWSDSWKQRAAKLASESLADTRPGTSRDETDVRAQAALQPLVLEFEHAQKVENAVENAIRRVTINGATSEERSEAKELVTEALATLP